jgi:hypothetical protein
MQRINLIRTVILIIIVISLPFIASGQSDPDKQLKNTIRVNISNPMIFGWKYNVIGYERVIKDYQTASVSLGRIGFPKLDILNTDSLGITDQYNDKGYNFSVDYRFYLRKENKNLAPRGVYIGPYYALNHFSRDVKWDLHSETFDGTVTSSTKIAANFFGAQLGYQFVLWNRMAIDLILMGPGWWAFSIKTDFDTSLPQEDASELLEKLNGMLQDKFPGSDFVITGDDFKASDFSRADKIGFRYMINLGFRF